MAFGTFSVALIILGLCCLATVLVLSLRKKKSAAERERERRLAVNAIGRLTEGVLMESDSSATDSPDNHLLFYCYQAAGVEYSAAQDITSLRHLIPAENCVPGRIAIVKYDPHNPSNSILVCELWSGLPDAGINAINSRSPSSASPRQTTLAH